MSKKRLSLSLIFATACISYAPALFFKLTYLDDHIAILDNYNFLIKWINLFVAFQRDVLSVFGGGAGYYRPFGVITMIWDAHMSGTNPFSFHLTNIILHAAVSCLLYLVLSRMSKAGNKINLILALLFAVHPISVPAVAWIPGRGETQLALLILLSFYYFLPGNQHFILHQLFLLCAIFTKESALIFPLVLAFYGFLYRGSPKFARGLALWRYYLGWVICALLFIFAKHKAVGAFASGMGLQDMFWSVINNASGVFLYIGKIFLPVNLSLLPILRDSNLIIGQIVTLAICAALAAILIFGRKPGKNIVRPDFRIIVFGLFWFLAFLLPSFIYPDLSKFPGFFEQRAYLPMVGILFALQEIAAAFKSPLSKYKGILSWLIIALVLVFAAMTFVRDFDFRDRLPFWKRAVKDSPHSAFGRKNLGAMYYLDDEFDLAEKEFQKSAELNPEETIVHNNLGLIQMAAGKFAEAEEEFKKEIAINPAYDNVYYNYGLLRYKEGKPDEAKELWQKAVNLNPGLARAWQALIGLATERKNQEEAQMYLKKAESIGLKL